MFWQFTKNNFVSIDKTKFIAEEDNYDIANDYIEKGWTLINTYILDASENNRLNQKIRYVLTWQHPNIEPPHPEFSFHARHLKNIKEIVDDMENEDY